jgi:exodeoxyribonuclease VII small subunit
MTDTYAAAKEQLDDIVAQVRKKDVSLERSLDLLEEGVALANNCTELIDHAAWESDGEADQTQSLDEDTVEDIEQSEAVESEAVEVEETVDNDEPTTEHSDAQ